MTAPDVPWLAVALLALSILALLHRPLGRLLRLAVRSAGGFLLPSVPGLVMIRVEM